MRLFSLIFLAALFVPAASSAYSEAEAAAFIKADKNGDKQIDRREFRVLIDEMAAIGAPKRHQRQALGRLRHGLQPRRRKWRRGDFDPGAEGTKIAPAGFRAPHQH